MAIQSQNPATGEILKKFDPYSDEQVEDALAQSMAAFKILRKWAFEKRAEHMRNVAQILRDEVDQLAKIATLEMGKTYAAAKAEILKSAVTVDYYADTAAQYLADDIVDIGAKKSYRKYLPLGPVLAVMPWNFPIWQVIRFAAPAVMAGNSCLLKHASNVPQCALYIEDIFRRAAFPEGAFQTCLLYTSPSPRD